MSVALRATVTSRWAGTQGKYFRGIFSSLSFENVRFQIFFFSLFLKSPDRDTDRLACPRREEEYLVGYRLGEKKKKKAKRSAL